MKRRKNRRLLLTGSLALAAVWLAALAGCGGSGTDALGKTS
jgi:hypothetical protein